MRRNKGIVPTSERAFGYGFVSPFFLIFLTFGLFPILYSIYIAFFNWDPLGLHTFVGMQNFQNLLQDDRFWIALRNTLSLWVLSTLPQLFMALGLASLLNRRGLKFAGFWRAAVLVPNVTSVVAVAVIFGSLFGRDFGIVNWLLHFFGIHAIDWTGSPLSSHLQIAAMVAWRWTSYNALIYLAAMQAIPKDRYESAEVDGANAWQQFRYVTVPGIRNTLIFTVTVSTIYGLQIFAEPLILGGVSYSGGDSRQYSTLSLFLFEQAFSEFRFGYAAAVGVVSLFIIAGFSFLNSAITRRLAQGEE